MIPCGNCVINSNNNVKFSSAFTYCISFHILSQQIGVHFPSWETELEAYNDLFETSQQAIL